MLAEQGLDFVLDKAEFVERVGPERDIETKAEEFLGSYLELVAEFLGIVDGSFELGVANAAFLGVDIIAGFELGYLLA